MINLINLQEIILLNLVEAIMTVYIVIDFRKYGKGKILTALLCCLATIYLYPKFIPLPIVPQILMTVVNAYVLSKLFNLEFKFCLKRIIALFLYFMLIIETPILLIYKYIIHIDFMSIRSVIDMFIMGIPVRILEIVSISSFKKSDIVDLKFIKTIQTRGVMLCKKFGILEK